MGKRRGSSRRSSRPRDDRRDGDRKGSRPPFRLLPVQPRPLPREHRGCGVLPRRGGRVPWLPRTVRGGGEELVGHHAAAEAADVLHLRLWASGVDHPVGRRGPATTDGMEIGRVHGRPSVSFRFSVVRSRENTEGVAFYRGEADEFRGFLERFEAVVRNWWGIMRRQRRLTYFTSGYGQAAWIIPSVVAAPRRPTG